MRVRASTILGVCLVLGAPTHPATAQQLWVSAGGSVSRVEASTDQGQPTFPLTVLERLGGAVTRGDGWVDVALFGDVLHFQPPARRFSINRELVALTNWTFQHAGTLYLPQRFFIEWLPSRYPDRVAFRDGVLMLFGDHEPPASGNEKTTSIHQSAARRSSRDAAKPNREQPARPAGPVRKGEVRKSNEGKPDEWLPGRLQGFVDTRLFGLYDSNIDRQPSPQNVYGTVGRLGVGIQSVSSRPFLTVRYDLGFYRYSEATQWNRTTHDVSAELAPSVGPFRPKVGGEVRVGSWTEDRELADQLGLRAGLEIWPSRAVRFEPYGAQRVLQINGSVERADTNRIGGLKIARRWRAGGSWELDGRYEDNRSEYSSSRYQSWSGRAMLRMPVSRSRRITLEITHRQRSYRERLVTVGLDEVPRKDRRWFPAVSVTQAWAGGHWEIEARYELDHNKSNDPDGTYVAHRIGFGLRRRW